MERFAASGAAETPFVSTSLQALSDARNQRNRAYRLGTGLLWISALTLFIAGVWINYINKLRALVYKSTRERGAEPVDELSEHFEWIDAAQHRTLVLRRRLLSWGMLCAACCLVAIGLGVTTAQLMALLIALAGPMIGLSIITRSPIGHIGSYDKQLMLVDHNQLYQLGTGAEIQYRGAFLLLHDVVVFCGNAALPTFNTAQVNQKVAPIARGAVKIDRRTLLVKLLESRPPIVQGVFAVALCIVLAAVFLLSPWLLAGLT